MVVTSRNPNTGRVSRNPQVRLAHRYAVDGHEYDGEEASSDPKWGTRSQQAQAEALMAEYPRGDAGDGPLRPAGPGAGDAVYRGRPLDDGVGDRRNGNFEPFQVPSPTG